MLLATVMQLAELLLKVKLMQTAGVLLIVYCAWALGQFFDKRKPGSYVKAFIAYLLGMATFTLLAVLIGFIADKMVS